jgi:hypothetical protein
LYRMPFLATSTEPHLSQTVIPIILRRYGNNSI